MIIPVFVGWDKKESVGYHVLANSIIERSSLPVAIGPVGNHVLPKSIWWRERGPYDTTDFSNARWIVPFLTDYHGWSMFMDSDILCRDDIAKLWKLRDDRYAVMCVQHDYQPKAGDKAMGKQTIYSKKNWSSVVLFNGPLCKALTLDYVNTANGLDLHQFRWLNPEQIGPISPDWNHLVGEYEYNQNAKLVHYTLGGPFMKGYEKCEYSLDWTNEYREMTGGKSWN